MLTKLELFEI